MRFFDAWAFALFVGISVAMYWRLQYLRRNPIRLPNGNYAFAGVGRSFCKFLDRYVEHGSVIYIPAGDGLYHHRTKSQMSYQYIKHLRKWAAKGATVNIMISALCFGVE